MDLLTDTLDIAGLKSRILDHRELPPTAAVRFPCARSIGFHVVLKGEAFIHTEKRRTPLKLERGDIALMARGCHHVLSTEEKILARATELAEFPSARKVGNSALTVVSGAYQLWNDPVHPLFHQLPAWFVLKNDAVGIADGVHQVTELLRRELAHPELGSERIVQSILDVLFSLIVRRAIKESGLKERRWAVSVRDELMRRTLELLHQDISFSWSLEHLAKRVGVSRSGLAARFKKLTGDSPLHYLTTLRVQKAMTLLTSSDLSVEQVALAVGYKDSFTFSKAFKKIAGSPPRDYRRRYLAALPGDGRLR